MGKSFLRLLWKTPNTMKQIHRAASLRSKAIRSAIGTLSKGERAIFTGQTDHEIVILGNGPSLNQIDLMRLIAKKRDFACVNDFAVRSDLFSIIKPRYYVIMDPMYFEQIDLNQRAAALCEKMECVDWEMTLVLPQRALVPLQNPRIHFEYISTSEINSYNLGEQKVLDRLYQKNLAVCGLQNVLCGALHYFILKKFPRIYLAGCDMNEFMSYSVDKHNHVLLTTKHFYGDQVIDLSERENLPIPPGMFHKWLGYYAAMLKQFYHYSKFAEYQGVKVYNLTEKSYIDCFEKIDWHTLIQA